MVLDVSKGAVGKRAKKKKGCCFTGSRIVNSLIDNLPGGCFTGTGIVNSLIDKLPVELHLPGGYQFCGPGTRLEKRLARGDSGINPLDGHCKAHDIAYRDNSDLEARHRADKILQEQAWERVKSKDANLKEKAAALAVTLAMKAKRSFGGGMKKRIGKRGVGLSAIRRKIATNLKRKGKGLDTSSLISAALAAAKAAIREFGGKKKINMLPRVIPIPKEGGMLPFLLPLFAGLSATGALAGGAAGIAKAVNAVKDAKMQNAEAQRHNRVMEAIALGNKASGGGAIYLKPYRKTGMALFLKPAKNL